MLLRRWRGGWFLCLFIAVRWRLSMLIVEKFTGRSRHMRRYRLLQSRQGSACCWHHTPLCGRLKRLKDDWYGVFVTARVPGRQAARLPLWETRSTLGWGRERRFGRLTWQMGIVAGPLIPGTELPALC